MIKWPEIDIWRMSASRPNMLKATQENILRHLKYSGQLNFHLIESIMVGKLSGENIEWGVKSGYKVHVIDPAKGQGYAAWYALNKVVESEYSFKLEDDFMPVADIPLDDCIEVMEKYKHINQISFNKRNNLSWKWFSGDGGFWHRWPKKQRIFFVGDKKIFLQVKEKWWFGSSIWRTSFIKGKFQYWEENTHNNMNDWILLPLAGYKEGEKSSKGRFVPSPEAVEEYIGCYLFGKAGDKNMMEHIGRGNSLFTGELKKKWQKEGFDVIGRGN